MTAALIRGSAFESNPFQRIRFGPERSGEHFQTTPRPLAFVPLKKAVIQRGQPLLPGLLSKLIDTFEKSLADVHAPVKRRCWFYITLCGRPVTSPSSAYGSAG
ncbi:hypothetical protein QQF64_032649 [Cirrhinus molitorella]|uniref:Uncharacterized protein n=1 Tax=Cirrhinus molitorella TaxID=172907 RepID=A0ABR3MRN2_9TELE